MTIVVWTTAVLLLWIVLWSLGSKAFDAAMLSVTILLVAATIEIVKRYLPNRR
ncbi:MAG: hypothetical protein M3389_11915 [Actinomycetota bacterium]|jgi:hypothetical protein|nr:hypothetical protein [Actinomycetota bacterium]